MKIATFALGLAIVGLLTGCGNSTPRGTDKDVQELVVDISTQEVRRQITPLVFAQTTGVPVGLLDIEITYEYLMENLDDEDFFDVVMAIDGTMDEMSIDLQNIRENNVQDEIKKSSSSADLVINDESTSITYTAQRNSDGDVYVEVFGLN